MNISKNELLAMKMQPGSKTINLETKWIDSLSHKIYLCFYALLCLEGTKTWLHKRRTNGNLLPFVVRFINFIVELHFQFLLSLCTKMPLGNFYIRLSRFYGISKTLNLINALRAKNLIHATYAKKRNGRYREILWTIWRLIYSKIQDKYKHSSLLLVLFTVLLPNASCNCTIKDLRGT